MLTKDEIARYDRQLKLEAIGYNGQENLKAAKVIVIGAGGLGCPVIQYLASAGIGQITIVDGDTVSESNLQRQVLFNGFDIGKPKAETAAQKARVMNPFINVDFVNEFLSVPLALDLFDKCDLVMDCCDNSGTRYLINDVCRLYELPFISSALFRTEGQMGIFNVIQESGIFSADYRDLFPGSPDKEAPANCNEAGVIATLPGIMGLMQANEALKYFINKSRCAVNKLGVLNVWDLTWQQFDITSCCTERKSISITEIKNTNYQLPCKAKEMFVKNLEHLQYLLTIKGAVIIDVREIGEMPEIRANVIMNIPLSELELNMQVLTKYQTIIFVCQSGQRSTRAIQIFKYKYPEPECYNFDQGISTLIQYLSPLNYLSIHAEQTQLYY